MDLFFHAWLVPLICRSRQIFSKSYFTIEIDCLPLLPLHWILIQLYFFIVPSRKKGYKNLLHFLTTFKFFEEKFQLCFFGYMTNGSLIYATWKSKTLKNPYGLLCAIIGGLNCCLLSTLTAFTIVPKM